MNMSFFLEHIGRHSATQRCPVFHRTPKFRYHVHAIPREFIVQFLILWIQSDDLFTNLYSMSRKVKIIWYKYANFTHANEQNSYVI